METAARCQRRTWASGAGDRSATVSWTRFRASQKKPAAMGRGHGCVRRGLSARCGDVVCRRARAGKKRERGEGWMGCGEGGRARTAHLRRLAHAAEPVRRAPGQRVRLAELPRVELLPPRPHRRVVRRVGHEVAHQPRQRLAPPLLLPGEPAARGVRHRRLRLLVEGDERALPQVLERRNGEERRLRGAERGSAAGGPPVRGALRDRSYERSAAVPQACGPPGRLRTQMRRARNAGPSCSWRSISSGGICARRGEEQRQRE